jgi:hypothetical protein
MPKLSGRPHGRQRPKPRPAVKLAPEAEAIPEITPARPDLKFLIAASVTCAIALLIFFRDFVSSRFNLIAADVGDGRLMIAILEHWWAVARHQAQFLSPNFFWPERGVLGYSDSLILFAAPYSIARYMGLDRYLAFELCLLAVQAIGFVSMVWLLHSFLRASRTVALVGALLFAMGNVYYRALGSGHVQLMAVDFCPLIAALACDSRRSHAPGRMTRCYCGAAACGMLLGLVLYTSFYIGWFTIVFSAVAAVVWAGGNMLHYGPAAAVSRWRWTAVKCWRACAIGATAFGLVLVPFALTYIPALRNTGGRSFDENLMFMAAPIDTLDVGPRNLVWGHILEPIYTPIRSRTAEWERQVGWPPLILLLTGLTAIRALTGFGRTVSRSIPGRRPHFAAVMAISAALLWLGSLNIRGHSFWLLMFRFVPGAAAIRVPERIASVLNLAVILIICTGLDELWRGKGRLRVAAFWCLAAFLVVEQLNLVDTHMIDRAAEREIFRKVRKPPLNCQAFFLAHSASETRLSFANQIDAMLVARETGVPTLNGYSGWSPSGWDLASFDSAYLRHVREWAARHKVGRNLCGLDLRDGSWSEFRLAGQ